MGEAQEIGVEQLRERMRESIERMSAVENRQTSENHVSPLDNGQAAADLAYLYSNYDVERVSFVSHRRFIGSLVVAVKNILRKLLTPILQRQVSYNAAVALVTARSTEWASALQNDMGALQNDMGALQNDMDVLERSHAQFCQRMVDREGQMREEIVAIESQLRREALAIQGELRQELRTTAAEEARATQSALREELLAAHRALREEILAVVSEEMRAVREELLATQHAAVRSEEMLRTSSQEIVGAQSGLREELATQSQVIHAARQVSVAAKERVSRAERTIRRIVHALETLYVQERPRETQPRQEGSPPVFRNLEPEFDYAGLEDRFRGTEDDIKERQRIYVPYFEGRENILDLGSGRGEFLELLRESGITARGLDVDLDMILLARDKGLDVVLEDAFTYLEPLPDDSVGGIFAAQIIEHLHPRRIIELVKLCYRKLARGAPLILETPNPSCLLVFAESFYKDPTHVQPIHADMMHFLFESIGFCQVELKFTCPVDPSKRVPSLQAPGTDVEQFNQGIERLNALLFGFQDYAVIGHKGGTSLL
jgi:2-polyprenyl-3-methyl-5-hydroxy-6-metoxy-1,4-benzoquinol methylase